MSTFNEGTASYVHEISLGSGATAEDWRLEVWKVFDLYEYSKITSHSVTPLTVAGTICGLIVVIVAHDRKE